MLPKHGPFYTEFIWCFAKICETNVSRSVLTVKAGVFSFPKTSIVSYHKYNFRSNSLQKPALSTVTQQLWGKAIQFTYHTATDGICGNGYSFESRGNIPSNYNCGRKHKHWVQIYMD
jgi:hypothetical protein